jgi:hypothetical protein
MSSPDCRLVIVQTKRVKAASGTGSRKYFSGRGDSVASSTTYSNGELVMQTEITPFISICEFDFSDL